MVSVLGGVLNAAVGILELLVCGSSPCLGSFNLIIGIPLELHHFLPFFSLKKFCALENRKSLSAIFIFNFFYINYI